MATLRAVLTGALAALLLPLLLSGCRLDLIKPNSVSTNGPHEMLNATLWQRTSAEYTGVVAQAWRLARYNLDRALEDPYWTAALEQSGEYTSLPPAILLDLDETVLDNTGYETQIITELGQFTHSSFAEWCHDNIAPAISGVKEFLDYAHEHDVAIFYYSSRREKLRECTLRNLRALELPLPSETRLYLSDGMTKTERRARVAQYYRILLLFGDNLEDFTAESRTSHSKRREIAKQHAHRWGREWIILPNPMYGHWESSMYDFEFLLPREEQLRRKLKILLD